MGNLINTLLVKSLMVISEKQFGTWCKKFIDQHKKIPTHQNGTSLTNKLCDLFFISP